MSTAAIGIRIRVERRRLRLSQAAFGALGGVGVGAEKHYEMGHRAPRADYLARLAAHGVDVLFLVTGARLPAHWRDQVADLMRASAPANPDGGQPIELTLQDL